MVNWSYGHAAGSGIPSHIPKCLGSDLHPYSKGNIITTVNSILMKQLHPCCHFTFSYGFLGI